MTAEQPKLRWHTHDQRKDPALKTLPATISAARSKTARGYTMEVLLPLSAIGVKPTLNTTIALQFWVNDADTKDDSTYHAVWFPADNTGNDHSRMHTVQLSAKAGPGSL